MRKILALSMVLSISNVYGSFPIRDIPLHLYEENFLKDIPKSSPIKTFAEKIENIILKYKELNEKENNIKNEKKELNKELADIEISIKSLNSK